MDLSTFNLTVLDIKIMILHLIETIEGIGRAGSER